MLKTLRNILLTPFSFLYWVGVSIRNWVYDVELIDSYVPPIPVISIGNLTVGGTGKTPFTEYLIQIMSEQYEVAILSRGYKRKTKGFVLADVDMDYREIGDEPMQMKLKFPSVQIAVCEDRVYGIKHLLELYPQIGLIILDDAFQYRKVKPSCNILLMDYNRPIYDDYMLPKGSLRDSTKQLPRADIVITTKCPEQFMPYDSRVVIKCLNLYQYQSLFFTKYQYSPLIPMIPSDDYDGGVISNLTKDINVIVMSGIANPKPLISYIDSKCSLVDSMIYPDHHVYLMKDIRLLESKLSESPENTIVVITEKDAVKLCRSKKINTDTMKRIYYVSVMHEFIINDIQSFKKSLNECINKYVKQNTQNS